MSTIIILTLAFIQLSLVATNESWMNASFNIMIVLILNSVLQVET